MLEPEAGFCSQSDGYLKNRGLEISTDTIVYVVAPARTATGGPELLHQLVYHLRIDLGYNAFMYYYPPDLEDPVHPEYKLYGNPYVREILDDPVNVLIVPEVISEIKILKQFARIQKVVWWLSVNNFLLSYLLSKRSGLLNPALVLSRIANKITKLLGYHSIVDAREIILRAALRKTPVVLRALRELSLDQVRLHLYQSHYAKTFLESLSITNLAPLSDYINPEFLNNQPDLKSKEDVVVFNSKKGLSFTRSIMKAAPGIRFIPIENMSRKEVIQQLKRSKVYIDFGDHPGKDRLPREAAILGCCVIVGKRGSAANPYDVPIPEEYKFEVSEKNIPAIVRKIKYCINNHENAYRDFETYREIIKQEPQKFIEDLSAIFKKTP